MPIKTISSIQVTVESLILNLPTMETVLPAITGWLNSIKISRAMRTTEAMRPILNPISL